MEAEAVSTSTRNSSEEKKKSWEEKARGKHWNEEATATLIDLWGKETVQLPFENSKSSKQSSQFFKSLLADQFYTNIKRRRIWGGILQLLLQHFFTVLWSFRFDFNENSSVFLCFNSQSSIHIILIGPVGKGRIQGYQSKRIDQQS